MTSAVKPNVFLVGAPKAGTSAMSNYLAQHPQVSICRIKEPDYFCSDFDLPGPRTEAEYLSLFPTSENTTHFLDASVHYMQSRAAAAEIAKYSPDARIIMMLRNPVDAMYSWHAQQVYSCNEDLTDFAEALEAEAERRQGRRLPRGTTVRRCPDILFYRDVMDYSTQVERFLQHFDRSQIHIISYDDLKANAAAVYRGVLVFLDLDPSFAPDFRIVNPAKQRRSARLQSRLKRWFAAPARALLPPRLRLDLINVVDRFNSKAVERAPLKKDLKAKLKSECLPGMIRLTELVGNDFTHWCK
jgi:hypothetical protein